MCTCLHMCRGHGRALFCHYPPHSFKAGSFPDLGICFQVGWQSASLSDPLSLPALLSVGVTRLHGDHTRRVAAGILTLVLTLYRKGLCLSQLFCCFKQCLGNRVLAGKGTCHQTWQFTASDCPPSKSSKKLGLQGCLTVPHNSMYSLSERCVLDASAIPEINVFLPPCPG